MKADAAHCLCSHCGWRKQGPRAIPPAHLPSHGPAASLLQLKASAMLLSVCTCPARVYGPSLTVDDPTISVVGGAGWLFSWAPLGEPLGDMDSCISSVLGNSSELDGAFGALLSRSSSVQRFREGMASWGAGQVKEMLNASADRARKKGPLLAPAPFN